jgi:hypothetical protein
VRGGLVGDRGSARHVLVRRVGARADQTDRELLGPVVLLDGLGKLGERGGQVGSVRAVDVRLELREVDLDDLVVLGVLVRAEVLLERLGVLADVGALGRVEVRAHALVVREDRGGGTDLGTHVADGGHASARERGDTLTEVLDDGARAALDGEDAGNLEDDVYERDASVKESTVCGERADYGSPLGVVQPPILPVRWTPIRFGHLSSQGMSAITSTASAPPTPTATIPRPPAFGVCESVPIMRPPGKA